MIEISKLTFGYSEQPVIKDLSLKVSSGDILGVIGPNGSGKTTLLKILSGVLTDYEGTITLNPPVPPFVKGGLRPVPPFVKGGLRGDLLKGGSGGGLGGFQLARTIAVVPQDSEIVFPFTSLDIVLMGRAPYLKNFSFESAEDLKIASRAMELTGTLPFANRYIQDLSGGEKQRVIIARAIAQSPKILLLDEPTTHLDIKHQLEILKLVQRLNEEGITIIITLHDIKQAALVCKSIVALKRGKIVSSGNPSDILTTGLIKEVFEAEVDENFSLKL